MIERKVPGFKSRPGINRNSDCSRRIVGISENVMTPDNPIDDET